MPRAKAKPTLPAAPQAKARRAVRPPASGAPAASARAAAAPLRPAPVPDPVALEAVAARVRTCVLCGLCELRDRAVPGEGTGASGIMLVGEAPGRKEDESGRPFVGAAGKNLDLGLREAGIDRADCFVTSIVKCRPPKNRDPTPREKEACRPYLLEQVRIVRPRVIVALGRHGLHGVMGDLPTDFANLAGTFIAGPEGVPVFVSLHPAAIIYRQKWKERYLADWRRLGTWVRAMPSR
ncbi:MAG TPA: uracil-DNA glycosylase [Candidatus Thermoplasmatota archaeon]|nr:uracil-DNA glycosylase [Candidatus Thermoplasmatota archaeon]